MCFIEAFRMRCLNIAHTAKNRKEKHYEDIEGTRTGNGQGTEQERS